jgi:dihydroneopterin aldolase/D-erythro-7,8-dihydroneopterin triphosphate epimerase
VFISITLETDTQAAAESDDIADAVNYRTLTKEVFEMVEGSQFLLVERMAEEIAKLSLRDERVNAVRVRVDKPGALRFARSVAIEIERVRE